MQTVPLAKTHARAEFSCGVAELDVYLQRFALQNRKTNVAAPFVLPADDGRTIIGFYTLSAFSVALASLPVDLQARLPKYPEVPAVLLGRLGVNTTFRGKGYGRMLLLDALHRIIRSTRDVAAVLVVVDAKDEQAADFYRKCEFEALAASPGRYFLTVVDAIKAFGLE